MKYSTLSENLYWHGTSEDFNQFDIAKSGYIGFFFTKDRDKAITFAVSHAKYYKKEPILMAVNLHIKTPIHMNDPIYVEIGKNASGGNPRKQMRDKLVALGYDAVIFDTETWVLDPFIIEIIDKQKVTKI